MKYITSVLTAMVLFLGVANSAQSSSECVSSCVQTERVGASLVITAYDANGQALKAEVVDLEVDAELISTGNFDSSPSMGAMIGGESAQSQTQIYSTTTETVYVTTTQYFNAAGDLVDVQVTTRRISNEMMEK